MKNLCTLFIRPNAESAQLKALGELLNRWSDEVSDDGLCFPSVDKRAADDLKAGELPQPECLRFTGLLHDMNKVSDILGQPEIELGEREYERIKAGMGGTGKLRAVFIIIHPLSENGPGEVSEAVERLRSRLSHDLVEGVDVVPMPDEPEEPTDGEPGEPDNEGEEWKGDN